MLIRKTNKNKKPRYLSIFKDPTNQKITQQQSFGMRSPNARNQTKKYTNRNFLKLQQQSYISRQCFEVNKIDFEKVEIESFQKSQVLAKNPFGAQRLQSSEFREKLLFLSLERKNQRKKEIKNGLLINAKTVRFTRRIRGSTRALTRIRAHSTHLPGQLSDPFTLLSTVGSVDSPVSHPIC